MISKKCPMCGTTGRLWNRKPEAFICPKCYTFFSRFGLILEAEIESDHVELWT